MLKKLIIVLLVLLLGGCSNYITVKKQILIPNKIIIDSLDIDKEISISSINDDINGIVMFYEYGRPNIEGSNTIIGAHSGYGDNALFNDLYKVKIDDEIIIYYSNKKYIYNVTNVYEVDETNTSVLNEIGYSSLTLMTCKKGDSTKRIIVISSLNSTIDM